MMCDSNDLNGRQENKLKRNHKFPQRDLTCEMVVFKVKSSFCLHTQLGLEKLSLQAESSLRDFDMWFNSLSCLGTQRERCETRNPGAAAHAISVALATEWRMSVKTEKGCHLGWRNVNVYLLKKINIVIYHHRIFTLLSYHAVSS